MDYLDILDYGRFKLIRPLVGFEASMKEQIQRYPYGQNVFLMMKFRQRNRLLSNFIQTELKKHGFNGVRADAPEWNITRNTYNPIAVLYCCRFGLALFDEPEKDQAYSPNVAYELGMMHYQDKNCLILRNEGLPSVPFDLVKDIYETYKSDLEIPDIIARWIISIKTDGALSPYDKPEAYRQYDSIEQSTLLTDVVDFDKFIPSVSRYLYNKEILTVADAAKIDFHDMAKQKGIGPTSVKNLAKELINHGIIRDNYFLKRIMKYGGVR